MRYVLIDEPIISRRIDRRTLRQKRQQQERQQERFEKFSEIFSVKEMAAKGFYGSDRPAQLMPYGVEVWHRHCTLRDERGEWYERDIATLALCLPQMSALQLVERLGPSYWEDSQTFYWGFNQRGNVPLYCILDLMSRLHQLPHWDSIAAVPVRWRAGNTAARAIAQRQIEKVNSGTFSLKPPAIPSEAGRSINDLRHNDTPYDYEWQTGKRPRNEAKAYWNRAIKEAQKKSEKT